MGNGVTDKGGRIVPVALYDHGSGLPLGSAAAPVSVSATAASIATASVNVTTTPAKIATARAGRRAVVVQNHSAVAFYLGGRRRVFFDGTQWRQFT